MVTMAGANAVMPYRCIRPQDVVVLNREPLETPVGLPEVSAKGCRRKSLMP